VARPDSNITIKGRTTVSKSAQKYLRDQAAALGIEPDQVKADTVRGAQQIGDFLGVTRKEAYLLLENKHIPAGKRGANWIASKAKLTAHYLSTTEGAV
jgi:hypothetical protein